MEDYLEMAYRLSKGKGYTRIGDLANALNVQPPSVSKMVQKLAELSYLKYEKYGLVELTEDGKQIGYYLLNRHETIEKFLRLIGVKNSILEETEKIEHSINKETLEQIRKLVKFMEKNKACREGFFNSNY